jgi:uncharacterized SAM-binding protein YcdF (DUF218 family)
MDTSLLDPIWLKAIAKSLVLPPAGLLLLALLGLMLSRRFPRSGRGMAWSGVVLLLGLSIPAISGLLIRSLDTAPPFDIANPSGAKAIVIIGGGTRRYAAEFGGDTLNQLTLERVRYGAIIARLTRLPILVSGGSVYGGETEAKLMAQSLERDFGQYVQWLEEGSRTTHENAQRSAEILRPAGIQRVVLVAHNFDMPRARAEFADARIETIPAPTGGVTAHPATLLDFLPSMSALRGSYYAIYEICAIIVRAVSPSPQHEEPKDQRRSRT